MPAPDIRRVTQILKALASENRLRLYLAIREAEQLSVEGAKCFTSDIAARLKIGAPTVSHHLKELERAGLIRTEREGKRITATLDPSTAALVKDLL